MDYAGFAFDEYGCVFGFGVGGICGKLDATEGDSQFSIYDCENNGVIIGQQNVGGIIGNANKVNDEDRLSFRNLKNKANISSTMSCVGGIFGSVYRINLTECNNLGNVNGLYKVGGAVGSASSSSLNSVYNSGKITSTGTDGESCTDLGGIVGWLNGGDINNCENSGVIEHMSSGKRIGGIVGSYNIIKNSTLNHLYNYGDIKASNSINVGGLFGYTNCGNYTIKINDTKSMGLVDGKNNSESVCFAIGCAESNSLLFRNGVYTFNTIIIYKGNQNLNGIFGSYKKANFNNKIYIDR